MNPAVEMITHTQHLLLRQLRMEDAHALNFVFGDAEVMRFSDGTKTPELVREWVGGWIDHLYAQWGFGMWAVVRHSDDQVIGYCDLSRIADRLLAGETEIGFRLAKPYWGQGYATEAVIPTRDYAFATLKIPKIVALIDPGNVASIRVVEKAGFTYERDTMLAGYDHPDHVYSIIRPAGG